MTRLTWKRQNSSVFVLFLLSFFLLTEWLWPLKSITDTGRVSVFIVFVGICFLFSYLRVPIVLSAIVKVFYMLYIYHTLFDSGAFFTLGWFEKLLYTIKENIQLIVTGDWWNLSGGFRSILLFILLWLVTYLIEYWLVIQKRIFFFLFLTVVYITVLDTFTQYDAWFAIVRIVLAGFLLISFLYLTRIKKEENFNIPLTTKWMVPVIIFLAITAAFAALAPKAKPILPDPVPFFKSYSESAGIGSGGTQKVGYGQDDSHLGGPFIQDHTSVFVAATPKKHYWRVESKDVYTGKGWKTSAKEKDVPFSKEYLPIRWFNENIKTTPLEDKLTFDLAYPHLVYPMGLISIGIHQPVHFTVNPLTEKISTLSSDDKGKISLKSYSLNYQYPTYSINALESVTMADIDNMDEKVKEQYTQLPNSLPERVVKLANEITSNKTNLYEKVKAVDDYFQYNGFLYDTVNVAVPGKEDDYVDQFLFGTKTGYCDNFSTSMVVLLRAVGIPARWVKGYTSGDFVKYINNTIKQYKVTNDNAHSWVEVYFPETGWVQFEPTIGFSNPTDFEYKLDANQQKAQTPAPAKKDLPKPEMNDKTKQKDTAAIHNESFVKRIWEKLSWKGIVLIILLLGLAGFGIYHTRRKWSPRLTIILYKHRKGEKVYDKAYLALLKQLQASGIKRKNGQTLRDFATYVDRFYYTNDMRKLTYSYEKVLYNQNSASQEWQKSHELWENLIKRTVS